jgi:hypothetical protein
VQEGERNVVVFSDVRVSGPKSHSFMALASFIIVRIFGHNHKTLLISVIKVLAHNWRRSMIFCEHNSPFLYLVQSFRTETS